MSTGATNNPFSVTIKGSKRVAKWLRRKDAETERALNTGVKVEGFRLRREMQADIRKGAPGGRRFKPLTYIARRMDRTVHGEGGAGIRQSPNRKPLSRLALAVRYDAGSIPGAVRVGFVGFGSGTTNQISSTWRRIAKLQQEGFTRSVSSHLRRTILERGGDLGTVEGGTTPFFLKKATRQFRTPARPIVQPFWRANKNQAARNIKRNFKLKMAGHRI